MVNIDLKRSRPLPRFGWQKPRGFTVTELMVSIGILVVLLAVAAPNLMGTGDSKAAESAARKIANDAQFARAEAVRRAMPVLLCPVASPGSTVCATTITTTSWATNGWLICYDFGANGQCDTSTTTDPNPIRIQNALTTGVTFTGPATALIFGATGNLNGVNQSGALSSIANQTFVSKKGSTRVYQWTVALAPSGAINVTASP